MDAPDQQAHGSLATPAVLACIEEQQACVEAQRNGVVLNEPWNITLLKARIVETEKNNTTLLELVNILSDRVQQLDRCLHEECELNDFRQADLEARLHRVERLHRLRPLDDDLNK